MCAVEFKGPKSSNGIQLSRFVLKSYCNSSDGVSSAVGGGAGGLGVSRVINYSLYEFRSVQR